MSQCDNILKEIHRKLNDTAHSKELLPDELDNEKLLHLINQCLLAQPGLETVRFLNAFQGKLKQSAQFPVKAKRDVLLEMNRKLDSFMIQRAARTHPPPLSQPVRYVKGVGERIASLFAKLDIHTVEDLLFFFPFRYEDRCNLMPIAELQGNGFVTIQGTIRNVDLTTTPRKRLKIIQVLIEDGSGTIVAKWFNQAYLKKIFQPGQKMILSGKLKLDAYSRSLELENPEYEILQDGEEETIHTNRIVPIYHTTAGLTQRRIRTIQYHLLSTHLKEIQEFFPEDIFTTYHLPKRQECITQLHFPDQGVSLDKLNAFQSRYHKRMIFEEFFLLEILLAMHRQDRPERIRGTSFQVNTEAEKRLIKNIPFPLTKAQQRVIMEIKRDMGRPIQMSRLLQGDVGCGKTIVAAVAAAIAMENGYQVAVMAPTEILAEQLYFNFHRIFDVISKKTALLTRLVKNQKKETLREQVRKGKIDAVVGTQALIQKEVSFHKLGLVIIDEQHRFGVIQRAALIEKGETPDVLVMTATPIPRSLSLTVYGDLDFSVIDEMPPGRIPIKTVVARGRDKPKVYRHIEKELREGRQAYFVYPLVEETEKSDLAAATEMSEKLSQEIFPNWNVGLLHGRMKAEDKEAIMAAFKQGTLHILVSTTVVEVGIDIPNATIMVIEHAERFGLAQLHQLRGRIGRDRYPSTCYLVVLRRMTEEASRRLSIMEKTNDGFKVAEEDLAIRGPGEFFGKRQSGMPELKIGNILRDIKILEAARDEAFSRIKKDSNLVNPGNRRILAEVQRKFSGRSKLIRVG